MSATVKLNETVMYVQGTGKQSASLKLKKHSIAQGVK